LYGICAPGTQKCTAQGTWAPACRTCPKARAIAPRVWTTTATVRPTMLPARACAGGKDAGLHGGWSEGICAVSTQKCVLSRTTHHRVGTRRLRPDSLPGTETCANMGTDDDCDGIVDNIPAISCNVNGLATGACLNGGTITGCNGTTPPCTAPPHLQVWGKSLQLFGIAATLPMGAGTGTVMVRLPELSGQSIRSMWEPNVMQRQVFGCCTQLAKEPTQHAARRSAGLLGLCHQHSEWLCSPSGGTSFTNYTQTCH